MFYSLKEDKQLLDGTMIVYGDADPVNNTYRVSDNSIRVMGPEVKSWYMKIGNQAKALVYGNGKTCQFNGNNCVISVSDGTWKFFIPTDAISKRVIFYADYDENQSSYEETGSTKFNITINDISPVEYTGKPIVTMTSGKTGSKMIDLIVKAGDTGTYYLAFELNDEAKTKYSSYKPTVVKFDITGTNISKGKTKLTDSKPKLENSGSDVPIVYLANGAKGSYKITVEACGACKGKFTLSYKVI